MGSSWGGVLAQGILGGVMGASTAAAKTAEDEIKEKTLRDREKFLSDLRLGEYKSKAKVDIENIPVKGAAETGVLARREEELRGGRLETKRQEGELSTEQSLARRQGETEQDLSNAPRVRAEKAEDERVVGGIRQGRRMAEIQAQGDNSIRVATATQAEARRNNWRQDSEGYYIDGNGDRVTRTERVEGRPVTVQIKGPAPKGKTREEETFKENLDSINRIIEQTRKDMNDPMKKREAEKNLPQLLAERDRLMGKPGAAESGPVKPKSQAEFDALPKGARYVNPRDGRIYIKK